jgi:hypothetical protein
MRRQRDEKDRRGKTYHAERSLALFLRQKENPGCGGNLIRGEDGDVRLPKDSRPNCTNGLTQNPARQFSAGLSSTSVLGPGRVATAVLGLTKQLHDWVREAMNSSMVFATLCLLAVSGMVIAAIVR